MAKAEKIKKYRKGRIGIVYAILAAVLILVSIVLACTVFFKVDSVQVVGAERYTETQILTVADVQLGTNLILTPGDQIAQRIYKGLPYVESVEVQKRFPASIRLVIQEAQPVAVVPGGDGLWILDSNGKILEKTDESMALQYIRVKGLELTDPVAGEQAQVPLENEAQLAALIDLMTALREQGLTALVSDINASYRSEISMFYDGRFTVRFLTGSDYNRKLRVLREISLLLEDWAWGTIDLKGDKAYYTPG